MAKINTAVILAGGAGTRINPYTREELKIDRPKPMIEIQGKPLLHWTLEKWLIPYGIKHIVFGVAFKKEFIINYFKKNNLGIDIDFSIHSVDGETGEGFYKAISRYVKEDTFLAMNGDELTNININIFADFHFKCNGIATIIASQYQIPYGILKIENNTIVGFEEKPLIKDKYISTGIYIFNKKILDYIPENGSIERIAFNRLAENKVLKSYILPKDKTWLTVNNLKQLEIAEKNINNLWRS